MAFKKELILYIIFGVLTTLVNILVYYFFTKIILVNYIISNILAWVFSVFFAYVTNRIWVFESKNENIIKECFLFFGGRLFSGVVDTNIGPDVFDPYGVPYPPMANPVFVLVYALEPNTHINVEESVISSISSAAAATVRCGTIPENSDIAMLSP